MGMWNRTAETLSRDELAALQLKGLQKSLRRVWCNEFYRQRLSVKGISSPEDIKSLDDLSKLPFFTKDDFRDAYPLKMNCVDRKELMEFHQSSGSTGTPVVMAYTKNDLNQWAECMARCYAMAGLEKGDAFQIMPTFGLFNGGFGCYHGCRKAHLFCVPASSGNTERQIMFIQDLQATILCCTPSYAAYLSETIHERGLRDQIKLKAGIFGAEAWSQQMREDIEKGLGIKAYDIYGLTEISGPGVAFECEAQTGMHINEDHFIAEIIDPETGEVLPEGSKGELVFSCITKEAFPLLRYRTKDICVLTDP